jgi:hypothetical protein
VKFERLLADFQEQLQIPVVVGEVDTVLLLQETLALESSFSRIEIEGNKFHQLITFRS